MFFNFYEKCFVRPNRWQNFKGKYWWDVLDYLVQKEPNILDLVIPLTEPGSFHLYFVSSLFTPFCYPIILQQMHPPLTTQLSRSPHLLHASIKPCCVSLPFHLKVQRLLTFLNTYPFQCTLFYPSDAAPF